MVHDCFLYTVLLLATSGGLLLIWLISCQQYCVSDWNEKERLKRILSTILFNSLSLILNILVYLSLLHPNAMSQSIVSLDFIACVFEALFVMVAFHIFRIFHIWSIDQLYSPINMAIPKWYEYFFNILQCSVILMVFVCYPLVILLNNKNWMIIFYIFIAIIIFIEALFALFNLRKIINLFKHSLKTALIKSAKRYIGGIYSLVTLIFIYSIFQIFMCIEILFNHPNVSFNNDLGIAVTHSFIFIVLGLILIIWGYQSIPCCGCCGYLPTSSVCVIYECHGFCEFFYYLFYCYGCCCCDDMINGYEFDTEYSKTAVLLQESTNNNTTATHTTDLYLTLNENTNISIQNQSNADSFV